MYQQGSQSLAVSVQDVTVVFSNAYGAFTSTPEVILPVVDNTSADTTILLIRAQVVAKSSAGFTVRLSAPPPTSNYVLMFMAGTVEAVFSVQAAGRRTSALSECTNPAPTGYFPFVNTNPVPETQRLSWATLSSQFAKYVPTPPDNASSIGAIGQWSVDENFLYTHDGILWGLQRRYTTWDAVPD